MAEKFQNIEKILEDNPYPRLVSFCYQKLNEIREKTSHGYTLVLGYENLKEEDPKKYTFSMFDQNFFVGEDVFNNEGVFSQLEGLDGAVFISSGGKIMGTGVYLNPDFKEVIGKKGECPYNGSKGTRHHSAWAFSYLTPTVVITLSGEDKKTRIHYQGEIYQ